MMKTIAVAIVILLAGATCPADGQPGFATQPTFVKADGKTVVAFAVSGKTDVEVSILDAGGKVVRHLAAGVLGGEMPPPAPLKVGLGQRLEWDGNDDYGQAAKGGPFKARVRIGMGVKLGQIAGGSPYLYFLDRHGDHGRWGINGLELKHDGKVYVVGHSSTLGPVAIRQYDVDGNYLKTVFPPPAGEDPEAMKGWGIHVKPDGTYTVRFNRLTDPSVSTTILDPELGMARLLPTPGPHQLSLWSTVHRGGPTCQMMTLNTDGTIPPAKEQMQGLLVQDPPIRTATTRPDGPVFSALSPDGKFFYLSGVYGVTVSRRQSKPIRDGFWTDGQVWKVDLETRTARLFFALDRQAVSELLSGNRRAAAKKLLGGIMSYSALHGVAVDKAGRVFVADRLDNCILVLDEDAKIIRKVPVKYPDAVAVSARTGALYVSTRYGCEYSGRGKVGLVKFDDWQTAGKPSVTLPDLGHTWYTDQCKHSYVVLWEKADSTNVWVAYTEIPVRVYADDGKELKLLKDFRKLAAAQGCHGFDRLAVDRRRETAYVGDNHSTYWRVSDWKQPHFAKSPVGGASLAIGPLGRHIYSNPGGSVWQKNSGVYRFHLDQEGCPPAKAGDTHRLTGRLWSEWCFTGNSDLGFGVAPNGNIAGLDQKGQLLFFHGTEDKAPWESTKLADLSATGAYGCVKFDLAGNLYVGARWGQWKVPPVFKDDRFATQGGGRTGCTKIVKYAPTGTLESGNLFPRAPEAPSSVYEVNFGAFDASCIHHTPRFDVDEFGRILYPTSIQPRVSLIDNAGNEILHFGTWGSRDSTGGLGSDLVPTKDIPMALPNSVAATDDYIYVADMVNLRVLRIAKTFAASRTASMK
jgi:DNA-binding beta-propeller fold protein YncE